ncbi:hypothetical protein HDE_01217 [Halotydeus destructor]|nr:hypothetical protein HDE_01217 [Halotydeus destructor]
MQFIKLFTFIALSCQALAVPLVNEDEPKTKEDIVKSSLNQEKQLKDEAIWKLIRKATGQEESVNGTKSEAHTTVNKLANGSSEEELVAHDGTKSKPVEVVEIVEVRKNWSWQDMKVASVIAFVTLFTATLFCFTCLCLGTLCSIEEPVKEPPAVRRPYPRTHQPYVPQPRPHAPYQPRPVTASRPSTSTLPRPAGRCDHSVTIETGTNTKTVITSTDETVLRTLSTVTSMLSSPEFRQSFIQSLGPSQPVAPPLPPSSRPVSPYRCPHHSRPSSPMSPPLPSPSNGPEYYAMFNSSSNVHNPK